jgi:hypothetical protein
MNILYLKIERFFIFLKIFICGLITKHKRRKGSHICLKCGTVVYDKKC